MNLPEITLTGSPYEMGYIHGSHCKKQALRSLETYRHRYSVQRGLSWDEARNLSGRFSGVFTGEMKKYAEQMRGIADGAGLEISDIMALNLRSEILYTGLKDMRFDEGECTAFSAVPPATKDGHVIAGQSWDFTVAQRDAAIIARMPAQGGRGDVLMFMEGGMVGGKGVTSKGWSLTINALTTKNAGIGVPLHVRMLRALEAKNFSEAFKAILERPVPVSANLILTDKSGLSFSIELDPEDIDILEPDRGVLVHTNHFRGPKLYIDHPTSLSGSTYIRCQRMNALMRAKKDLTIDDFEAFLRDHAGWPSSICSHPDPGTPPEDLPYAGATNHAFIADLTTGEVRFAEGNPCESEFVRVSVLPGSGEAQA